MERYPSDQASSSSLWRSTQGCDACRGRGVPIRACDTLCGAVDGNFCGDWNLSGLQFPCIRLQRIRCGKAQHIQQQKSCLINQYKMGNYGVCGGLQVQEGQSQRLEGDIRKKLGDTEVWNFVDDTEYYFISSMKVLFTWSWARCLPTWSWREFEWYYSQK